MDTIELQIKATGKIVAARIMETKVVTIFGDEYAKDEVRIAKTRIVKPFTKHLYTLSISKDGVFGEIDVEANNRSQACAIVDRAGFTWGDCNMVG